MTATAEPAPAGSPSLSGSAADHLWLHFTRHGAQADKTPVIVRGEGAYVWDENGKRYLDGLAGLFAVQVGHGRAELADAAARQLRQLDYFPLWGHAHPAAIELGERLAASAPGDLNRVFFTVSGGESVETAWKLAKQYFKLAGKPTKHKVISRSLAYHGTSQGALSITGLPGAKQDFEPLVPSTRHVPNTNFYRAPVHGDDYEAFGRWAADQIAQAIEFEGPDTVAAVYLEPVQNTGGCFVPPPGYFERVRKICDDNDVLLVSDEVICAFGRLGHQFGASRYGYQPDLLTVAKGLTSAYAPLGAVLISDRIAEPFLRTSTTFMHGSTYGGHPMACAVGLANLDLIEREGIYRHVLDNEARFKSTLDRLLDLPIVGDVRGAGFFYGIELVKDKATKETFNAEESERILRDHVSGSLFENGLYCRADDRGEPVIQLSPPLICDQTQFDEMEQILRDTLTGAWKLL
ncbi:aspartate aminotransferase family protein [Amycolatopsis sp. NPDC058986]|uniref:aspartate aminotransferase family protein n=1 Tax=unclassified Amycolatopsis TaxID=2618356 RepID=UPI00366F0AC2